MKKGLDNAGQFTHAELIFELVCADAVAHGGSRVNILATRIRDTVGWVRVFAESDFRLCSWRRRCVCLSCANTSL